MSLSDAQKEAVEEVLKKTIRAKFAAYSPEPAVMPFHTRLLGRDRLALYQFVHSLNTSFGEKVFEPVALALAEGRIAHVERGRRSGKRISRGAQARIQEIMDGLSTADTAPNKSAEIERIRDAAREGDMVKVKPTKVDLTLRTHAGAWFLFDIKTAKPNAGGFKEFKRTLLEWVGVMLAENPEADVNTLIAIPYNPYAPKPYARWTIRGMLDLERELLVAEEFWDFLGGENSYEDLLGCFERVGIELREEIDVYFARFV